MENDERFQFYCPRCDKSASVHETLRRDYAAQALRTPYFLCGECRLMFISKQLVRKVVSEWWHGNKSAREASFKYFYDESMKYLYGTVLSYHQGVGYKLARFKKRQPQ
ncbi:MAG: hypothetical protein Q7R91_01115 [bacterium]|nr:hypothetical protein [bacterium]